MTTNAKWLAIGTCALAVIASVAFALKPGPITPSSAMVRVGQMQEFVTTSTRVEIALDRIANGSAHIALSGGPNCAATMACPEFLFARKIAVLSPNQSVTYGGITFALAELTSTTATFRATSAKPP